MIARVSAFVASLLLIITSAISAPPESINLRHTITVGVVQRTKEAIVNVASSSMRSVRRRIGPDLFMDPFTQIVQVPVNSLGSGFIVHADGYVVTNNHVIDRAREITVELSDGRKLKADLVSADPDADLAILRIHSDKPLPVIDLGDSSDLMIGEPAIAIGNPLGFSHSVSTGIVSALHRDLKGDDQRTLLSDLIQTDAAINPGNSGGPLLNAYGQVIGINTAIRGDAQNIGFAIPINRLRDLVPELMNPAQVSKLNIPIKLKEVRRPTPPANINAEVRLADAKDEAPIARINGRPITNIIDAYAALLQLSGDQKSVTVEFANQTKQTVEIHPIRSAPPPEVVVQARDLLGVTVEQVTPGVAQKYGLRIERGLFVSAVRSGSPAAAASVEPGDVILGLGRVQTNSLTDLAKLLPQLPKSGIVRVTVVRGDQIGYGQLQFKSAS